MLTGEITIHNLRTGNYRLIEKNTGKWYNLAGDTEVNIAWDETTQTTVENELKKGQIKVIKVDKDNNKLRIPGVTFEVLNEKNELLEKIVTDTNGEAITKRYSVRDYENIKLHEIETDQWYVLNDEVKTIKLEANQIKSITFENEKKKGQIQVIKIDKDNHEIKLQGVVFDVLDEQGNVVDTITTDKNGEAITKLLPIDQQYTLQEVETLEEYLLSEETKKVELQENQITSVTFENELKKGQVKVIKVDKYNNEIKLEGVKFNVLDEDNNVVDTLITNEDGEATSKKLRIDKQYKLQEVETLEIYDLTEETKTVELKENQITGVTFENELKKAKINIIKVDKDNNEIKLEGIKFNILDNENNIVDTIITNSDGEATSKELTVDKSYTIQEVETLDNYVLNNNPITIKLQPGEVKNIEIENELKKGQIKVIKIDKDNNQIRLAGVEFNILDEDNNVVGTLITNSNGEAVSDKLRIDKKYKLQETKTLQEYVLSENEPIIELSENEITSINFENEKIKGYIEITKIDKNDDSKVLKGAKFGIYNENDELVQELTTDENGKATSEPLIYGKYYLKELETGSIYYLLNKDTLKFEITTNGETLPITISNEPVDITVDVDKTGTVEIKPGEKVDYVFSNVANNSNVYLDNFKWYDYIPTDYVRLEEMTTGTWNQDLSYSVYYKTNKSKDYVLFKENLSTQENYNLDFTTIELAKDEYIIETMYDFGKVEKGFRESISPTMQCKSLDTLKDGQTFTNHTRTVGIYGNMTAEANSKWTTIVHVPKVPEQPTLPKTGR